MINPNCARTEQRYIDLSHRFIDGMPVYPGDEAIELIQVASVKKDKFSNFRFDTGMHVGTHMDGPAHMIDGAKSLYEYAVERFFGYADVIDAREHDGEIDVSYLQQLAKIKGDILLINTGHSRLYGSSFYYEEYPVITASMAEEVVSLGYQMIGLDTPSPDYSPYNIHQILLSNDVLIIENLKGLDRLPKSKDIFISALPLNVKADSAPVRVVAELL